jgi:Putative zinc-finger
MDHQEIQQSDMIDRYLAERLTDEEASRFEEHLLECPSCLEQVRWAEDFQDAVRSVGAQEQAQAAAVQAGVLAWLVRRSQVQRRALLLAASLLVAAPPAWLLWRQGDLERHLATARAAAVRAERQAHAAESRAPVQARVPAAPLPEAAPAGPAASFLLAERQRLEEDLRRERQASTRLQEQIERLSRPQGAALVALGFVRSGPGEGQAIRVAGAGGVVLSVEMPAGAEPAYRATLRGGGKVLWRGDRLQTGVDETLLISFPAGFLRPGSYRLQLEALPREAGTPPAPAVELPFQILPAG